MNSYTTFYHNGVQMYFDINGEHIQSVSLVPYGFAVAINALENEMLSQEKSAEDYFEISPMTLIAESFENAQFSDFPAGFIHSDFSQIF